jgi:hypothetical protein
MKIFSLPLIALAGSVLYASAAPASVICVHDSAELQQAALMAQTQPMTIQIMQGTYAMPPAWAGDAAVQDGTDYLGGYLDDCTGYQYGAGNTVIQSNSATFPGISVKGSFVLADLTIALSTPLLLDIDDTFDDVADAADVQVLRSNIHGLEVRWRDVSGAISISDTLIVHSDSDCALKVKVLEGDIPIYLINNTVANNSRSPGTTSGVCYFLNAGYHATLFAYNNIFYGNSAADLYADNGNLNLVANIIGSPAYPPPQLDSANLNGDPLLDPVTFRPSKVPLSIAINSGNKNPPGGIDSGDSDNAGNPRLVGSKPDRGAFESNVDDSTIQHVTNTNDSGDGSLRLAINNANSTAGANVVQFDISAACPNVIILQSDLPDIKGDLRINGYSQTGTDVNQLDVGFDANLCVLLSGSIHAVGNGLHVPANANGASLAVSGLAFEGFQTAAINLEGGGGHTIAGNRIGGLFAGSPLDPVQVGVILGAGVSKSSIGTHDRSGRNLIGAADGNGIEVAAAAHDNEIVNNYVGVGWNGDFVARGNFAKGVVVSGDHNLAHGNLIGFNGNDGIDLNGTSAHDNAVEFNNIGTDGAGANLANGSMGVRVENGGHDNVIRHNSVAQNAGTGVRIVSGLGNTIRQNSIHDNGSYGIDLAGGGVTANDDDSRVGSLLLANRALNFPVITVATGSRDGGVVSGTLQSTAGTYVIDVYSNAACDGSGHGEGARWLGSASVTINPIAGQTGSAPFSVTFSLAPPAIVGFSSQITATATDAAGNLSPGNTSEFSACSAYSDDVIFADGFG